jgi:transcription antitermination factor NusG
MSAKWYIVHAQSGSEKRAAEAIKEAAGKKGLGDLVENGYE